MKFDQLPLLAGRILKRLGRDNVLDIAEATFTQKIQAEQEQRTRERKAAQIARAMKGKKRRGGIELFTQQTEEKSEANGQAIEKETTAEISGTEADEENKA